MRSYVESVLESKNIFVSEETLNVLTYRWKGFINLREEIEALNLEESDMGLIFIPRGGWSHE